MSDHSFARAEDVQSLGQTPSPNQIGQQIKTLTRKAAEASRIALECHLEIAKLLQMMVDHHGYKSKRFVEFALANGVSSRTDAYDMLLLSEADDVLTTDEADPYREYPSWRALWREIKQRDGSTEPEPYWLTPPELDVVVRQEIGDYHDACPYPCPPDYDALEAEWPDGT